MSAFPLLIFFISPENKPIRFFLPLLYSKTLSGIFNKTSSTHECNESSFFSSRRLSSSAIFRGSLFGNCNNEGKIRVAAAPKLTVPFSTISIRNVKRAIDFEIGRIAGILENGEEVIQQTRSFDALTGTTFSLRDKEEANDYRYFPEPDLTPFFMTKN